MKSWMILLLPISILKHSFPNSFLKVLLTMMLSNCYTGYWCGKVNWSLTIIVEFFSLPGSSLYAYNNLWKIWRLFSSITSKVYFTPETNRMLLANYEMSIFLWSLMPILRILEFLLEIFIKYSLLSLDNLLNTFINVLRSTIEHIRLKQSYGIQFYY